MSPWKIGIGALIALCVLAAVLTRPIGASPPHLPFGTQLLSGEAWLGGHGVDVYSNGRGSVCRGTGCDSHLQEIYVGIKWQCVELAQRLYASLGWSRGAWGVDAWGIYQHSTDLGMERHPNGSGYTPVPGDLVVVARSPKTPAGHVSIVNRVFPHRVEVVEQNWNSEDGFGSYRREGSMLSRDDLPVVGLVHDPDNTGI